MLLSTQNAFKGLFFLLAAAVSAYALCHYWIYSDEADGIAEKFKSLNSIFVYAHLVGGAAALLSGAAQLFTAKGSRLHRQLGIGYCLAVVIAGIGGGYLSFFAEHGPSTGVGFFILDVLWFYTTFMAVRAARTHQTARHRRWIIRSLALTAAAISLRIELLLYTLVWNFETSYLIVAWSCWLGNLLLAEVYLFYTSLKLTTTNFPKGNLSL